MSFNPRDPKSYESASEETLIANGVGHGGNFSGSVIVEATRRLRHSIDKFNQMSAAASDALRRSIEELNASSTRQASTMIGLGWATVGLSIVMLIFAAVQVWLALRH